MHEASIVRPIKGKKSPDPGNIAVLTSTRSDVLLLRDRLGIIPVQGRPLFTSHLYAALKDSTPFSIVGPLVGAPYAAMLLETLAAWGVQRFIFWGWCGAIGSEVNIGDVIVATSAVIDEGTSRHYDSDIGPASLPSAAMTARLARGLDQQGIDFLRGSVWSTDAIFRETPSKIRHHQKKGILAVDMELSALFTVAAYLGVELGGVLVVSDDLSTLKWSPGFKDRRFTQARLAVCRCLVDIID